MNRDLRRHKRVKIPEDAGVSCEGIDTDLRGPVLVMGMRGAFIRTPVVFPKGTILDMRIRDGEREVETRCAVRDLDRKSVV